MRTSWKSKTEKTIKAKVGPRTAKMMLDMELATNRKTPRHTDTLAEMMTSGEWVSNGDPIKFIKDGTMVDGGNRLRAVIQSGKAQVFPIALGLERKAIAYINTGDLHRNKAQAIAIDGKISAGLAKHIGPAIPRIVSYKSNNGKSIRPSRMSNAKVVKFANRDKNIQVAAEKIDTMYKRGVSHITGSSATFLYYEMRKVAPEKTVDQFFSMLLTGENIPSGHPILRLREKLDKAKMGLIKWSGNHKMEVIVRCWNIMRTPGRKVTNKSLSPVLSAPFPKIK